MKKGYKLALAILLSAVLLISLAGISLAATQTTRTGFGYGLRLRAGDATIDAVSKLLGIEQEELRTQRLAGKSVADIAKDKGVDVEKLKDAILESRKALLEERVKAGILTQEQADAILKQMGSHISLCLENGAMPGGCGLGMGRGGMMGSGGMMGQGGMMGRMGMGMRRVLERDFIASVNRYLAVSAFITVLLAAVVSLVLSQRMTTPIRQVTRGAHEMAIGNLAHRVAVDSRDEIGELAESFNLMAASLENAETIRRNMIADIAHELRTPLTGIQGVSRSHPGWGCLTSKGESGINTRGYRSSGQTG